MIDRIKAEESGEEEGEARRGRVGEVLDVTVVGFDGRRGAKCRGQESTEDHAEHFGF